MPTHAPHLLVLGSGPVARVLTQFLGCGLVARQADNGGWDWPLGPRLDSVRLVLAAGSHSGISEAIRLHEDVPSLIQRRLLYW